ncbi:MAG: YggS family pyridoxal phosphate-dependent enzyme [Actinomycetota bacterium]|nr:YggS family pyridoxal phosphate-dependent enzyme [Actinomycetota bacterium]
MTVEERYAKVLERVQAAARRAARQPEDIRTVAVSKTFPANVVAEAARAGVTDFGENRAQELAQKVSTLGTGISWHFVGPLQTNKVKLVVGSVALIHSVDRHGLAEAIARRARALGLVQEVLIEVNIAGEPTKHGCDPAGMLELARRIEQLDGIRVAGLMAVPPEGPEPQSVRPYMRDLAALRDELLAHLPGARELSMGMSRDLEIAVEEGATIVRVGEAIFGPRSRSR